MTLSFDKVVDMRWGVRDEMTNEHMTTALCMNELRKDNTTCLVSAKCYPR